MITRRIIGEELKNQIIGKTLKMLYYAPQNDSYYIGNYREYDYIKAVNCDTHHTAHLTASKVMEFPVMPPDFFAKFKNQIHTIGGIDYFQTNAGSYHGCDMFLLLPIFEPYDASKAVVLSAEAIKLLSK